MAASGVQGAMMGFALSVYVAFLKAGGLRHALTAMLRDKDSSMQSRIPGFTAA
jgi:hypothetical protein